MTKKTKSTYARRRQQMIPWIISTILMVCISILLYNKYEGTRVIRVPDGDSLDLADGRRIRLLGIDAPEKGRCIATEAKNRLSYLVLGKHVKLKHTLKDEYGRTLAAVFVGSKLAGWIYSPSDPDVVGRVDGSQFINQILVAEGFARAQHAGNEFDNVLLQAYKNAEESKMGIFSPRCRQTIPPPSKLIKGNIRSGQSYYYLPNCKYYGQVIVDTSYGDAWFTDENEAKDIGFIPAPSCD